MDWRNYQFWRKSVRRLDETSTEFDVLIQRAKQRIAIEQQIRESFRLFQRLITSEYSEMTSYNENEFRQTGRQKNDFVTHNE